MGLRIVSLKEMPITRKVMIAPVIIAVALLFLAMAYFALQTWTKTQYEAALAQHAAALDAQRAVATLTEGHMLLQRAAELSDASGDRATVSRTADDGRERIRSGMRMIDAARHVDRALDKSAADYDRAARQLIDLLMLEGASTVLAGASAENMFESLRLSMSRRAAEATRQAEMESAEATQTQRYAGLATLLATALALTAAFMVSRRVGRAISAPLSAIVDRVVTLAGGALHEPIPEVDSRDEVGAIAEALQVFRQTALALHEGAFHDPLTKLANRASFDRSIEEALASLRDSRDSISIMMMDLDRFKEVNDTLGHDAGDELLIQVSDALREVLGPKPVLARLGGDEFAVMIQGTWRRDDIEDVAMRINERLSQAFCVVGQNVYIGVSIGIARSPEHGRAKDELLKQADLALYASKERSRNTFSMFQPEMLASINRRLRIEKSLRDALDADTMSVAYQPQIDLATGRVVGVEALARWGQDERDNVAPLEFLPIAEATGLIHPLGEFVAKTAFRQWAALPNTLRLSLNISPQQLKRPDFVELLASRASEFGVDRELVTLELSERAVLDDDAALEAMRRLRDAGFGLALDDFGVGSATLRSLQKLPFTELKIDGSFVHDIEKSSQAEAILRVMIGLGQSAGLRIVAECVETRAQADLLAELGCHHAQGYLFCRPVSGEGLANRIAAGADSLDLRSVG